MNKNVYSVSQVNTYIERMFSDDFMLGNLSLSGEVSNCKYNHTGHIYFTLKDEKSAISCVMFAGKRPKGLKFQMKDGDKVVVTGYVGIYAVAGKYQVYANEIEILNANREIKGANSNLSTVELDKVLKYYQSEMLKLKEKRSRVPQ